METPPTLTIEPIGDEFYRVFLDEFEITHCTGIEFKMTLADKVPRAVIELQVIVDAINMERISEAREAFKQRVQKPAAQREQRKSRIEARQ